MKKVYQKDRANLLKKNKNHQPEIFTEERISGLPELLKRYLRVSGYIDTPVPINAQVHWTESYLKMAPGKNWTKLQTLQFNSVKPIGRVAYMKFASMPVAARDLYYDAYGEMKGQLLYCIPLIFDNSRETAQSALITTFCEFMFIPGYLLLDNVKWEQVDDTCVRAALTDAHIRVSGNFYFNEEGLFTHFETMDRFYTSGKNEYQKIKFSARVEGYKKQDGLLINEKVQVIWHLPDGDFPYYKGTVDKVSFNVTS